MPNGDAYNHAWCDERHKKLDEKIRSLDNRIWAILLLLLANLGGVIGIFLRG